jgi:maltooligosyltrehalose trehalohydrolase
VSFRPRLGAIPLAGGTRFRVWAPAEKRVEVAIERAGSARPKGNARGLQESAEGFFEGFVEGVGAGDRYRCVLGGAEAFPDPASRFQPEGVHGPSQVIDPSSFPWSDRDWPGVALEDLVLYELHLGTFTPEGTFAAAAARLPHLRDLGVTAVELMPVAEFPGRWNWGYDGAALFAPSHRYGTPDEMRAFVDRAHALGLAVHLDVVYNHFGPDGAYAARFSPFFFSERHRSPWGAGINLDGGRSEGVRGFFVENALHWIHEYHVDGLRIDATHAMVDESPRHFLADLAAAVHASGPRARRIVIAEDARNLASIVRSEPEGGWGLDAVWSDDFHHEVRRMLTGDRDGYFRDFSGTTPDLATTVRRGWLFTGQRSEYAGRARGTDPSGIPPSRFVFFLQNHDQVGNRAFGDRLHERADPPSLRAATALLLLAPQTPLLFMGQEWAARSPFRYFTDHEPELGRRVTEGRRREFQRFAAFADPASAASIPDPQSEETFRASRLAWEERDREPHVSALRYHRALLDLRRRHRAPAGSDATHDAVAPDESSIALRLDADGRALLLVARILGDGETTVPEPLATPPAGRARWERALTSEDPPFAPDSRPPAVHEREGGIRVRFHRPGAAVWTA